MGSLNSFKEVLNRLWMYGNGYSMAIVLDYRSTATSLTGNHTCILFPEWMFSVYPRRDRTCKTYFNKSRSLCFSDGLDHSKWNAYK